MKSIVKTALSCSMLFALSGCMDFGWKNKQEEPKETVQATAPVEEQAPSKCSHKGCTQDHSKDENKKHHNKKHAKDNVEIQSMDDMDDMDDMDMDDADVEVDMDDMDMDMDDNA